VRTRSRQAPTTAILVEEQAPPATPDPPPPVADTPAVGQVGWFAAALRSDRGQVRDENQDAVFGLTATIPPTAPGGPAVPFGFFAVADGMGGLAEGGVASSTAIRMVAGQVITGFLEPLLSGIGRGADQGTVGDILSEGLLAANAAIYRQARRLGAPSGTTFSGALLLGRHLTVAHVGDSRVYLFGPEGLRRLTQDHSMVGRLIEMGHMQPEDVYNNPQRNALYRSLGQAVQVAPEVASYPLGSATHLVICSDGLWDVVGETVLAEALVTGPTVELAADHLVAQANALGGPDNISVVVVWLG
jgi:serine/threonine protein phosphatase PrpC